MVGRAVGSVLRGTSYAIRGIGSTSRYIGRNAGRILRGIGDAGSHLLVHGSTYTGKDSGTRELCLEEYLKSETTMLNPFWYARKKLPKDSKAGASWTVYATNVRRGLKLLAGTMSEYGADPSLVGEVRTCADSIIGITLKELKVQSVEDPSAMYKFVARVATQVDKALAGLESKLVLANPVVGRTIKPLVRQLYSPA